MAIRPVFECIDVPPYYREKRVEFIFCPGFSIQQQQRSIQNLHTAYLQASPNPGILEISTKSCTPLGVMLSAFNLKLCIGDGVSYPVETVFQAGKVFNNGLTADEVLNMTPSEAKKYMKRFSDCQLSCFCFMGQKFPLEPKTLFYDWLYVNAIQQNINHVEGILQYDAFSDIAFNPQKSINCQARSAAIYVSLVRQARLNQALKSPETFSELVYNQHLYEPDTDDHMQFSFF